MQKKHSTRRKQRPPLKKEHYETYWLVLWSLDYEDKDEPAGGYKKIHLDEWGSRAVRRQLRRLARLAGVPEREKPSKTFDDALKAVYMREREDASFDTGPAFRSAERIRRMIEPYAEERDRELEQMRVARNDGERVMVEAAREFGTEAIEELLRLVAEGGHSKGEILRRVRALIRKKDDDGRRVDELRERLRELEAEGEAHNESAVFKLRREIYDLEHPADDWNDWSAWEEDE